MSRFAQAALTNEYCHDEKCGVNHLCDRWIKRNDVDLACHHYGTMKPLWLGNDVPCPSGIGDFGDLDE